MAVSLETLNGLARKVTVSVPSHEIESKVDLRLKNLSTQVKIDGFRPGKAPFRLVVQRYGDSVREEIIRDMVQSTLYDSLKEVDVHPAEMPTIEFGPVQPHQDFTYTATFEVFPDIQIQELNGQSIDVWTATVQDEDVTQLIEKLRVQHKIWQTVERPVALGDRVTIDFSGFIEDQPMEHGQEKNYTLEIGQGRMIDGFESGLVGATLNTPVTLNVTFPEDYHAASIAGKDARFDVTIHKIETGILPEVDDNLAVQLGVQSGGVDALMKEIRQNMVRELDRRLGYLNRERAFNLMLDHHVFEAPKALVDQEIGRLQHEFYHQIFGHEHHDDEKIPDFPRELFEDKAIRRVRLGLLFADYVKHHELRVDEQRLNAMLDKLALAYDDPEALKAWYHEKESRMAELETLVLEEMVAEKIMESCELVLIEKSYEEIMNPKKEEDEQ